MIYFHLYELYVVKRVMVERQRYRRLLARINKAYLVDGVGASLLDWGGVGGVVEPVVPLRGHVSTVNLSLASDLGVLDPAGARVDVVVRAVLVVLVAELVLALEDALGADAVVQKVVLNGAQNAGSLDLRHNRLGGLLHEVHGKNAHPGTGLRARTQGANGW